MKPCVPVSLGIFGPNRNAKRVYREHRWNFFYYKDYVRDKTANHFGYIVEDRNDLQTDNKFLDKLPFSLY